MGQWEPPEGWEKATFMMRKDFHKKVRMIAAEAGVREWQVIDRLFGQVLKGKKLPKFEELPE